MKGMLYMTGQNDPVVVFNELKIVRMNDNHAAAPVRIFYKSEQLNAQRTIVELHRDEKMSLKIEDGRTCDVLLQHSSLDMDGNFVGILRVLGDLTD